MDIFKKKKKNKVLIPDSLFNSDYLGDLFGIHDTETGIFNIFTEEMVEINPDKALKIGAIVDDKKVCDTGSNMLLGYRHRNDLDFYCNNEKYIVEVYNLTQNIFSRNTGILETDIMADKCAIILGCGSVGSLVALELARAGVGNFVLVDNDVLEYHNICRHQCSIMEVGQYKVNAVAQRIREINPYAKIEKQDIMVEQINKEIFDTYCKDDKAIIVGCADNREADVYANGLAVMYNVPFISIGFWERAFAGEIFYYLPNSNMPCYKCALGDGGNISGRSSANRRVYTTQEDLVNVNFEPGISIDINFVTTIGIKLILDILNINNDKFTPRVLDYLKQYTLVCNTNKTNVGGEMAEIFSNPLQVTNSLRVGFSNQCPPCEYKQ